MAIVREEKQLTVANAMNNGTTLMQLEKKSPVVTTKIVMGLILRQADLFNLRNNFDEMQAAVLASDLMEVFGYETLEDIVMMFKLARQGKLGKIYGRLDSETVMGTWIPAYLELKSIERERSHQQKKKQIGKTECSPKAKKMLDLILKKISEDSKPEVRYYYPKFTNRCKEMCKLWPYDVLIKKLQRAKELKANDAIRILGNEVSLRNNIKIMQDETRKQ